MIKRPKFLTKDFLFMILTSAIVSVVCLLFLFLVGVPMTQARNHYNSAVRLYNQENYQEALLEIRISQEIWNTNEAGLLSEQILQKLSE
ncbi:hypothetical protein H3C67_01095 [Candidatus Dojkabacteria bacterium]|uniref:Uncharacterized protein n=2 Tax=Candidatus Dojkabacteria TaxID=74243 RepID=A0A952AJI8_9BACT|nr:hypothetical protein [Candidatus Dojkabacteria bacterium]